jgi:hypothetical protein
MADGDVFPHPNKGEQMVRYYGQYSNVSRGKRQMGGKDETAAPVEATIFHFNCKYTLYYCRENDK